MLDLGLLVGGEGRRGRRGGPPQGPLKSMAEKN